MDYTLYDLDRLLLATLDSARSGQQPTALWLARAPRRRLRFRRAGTGRARPAAAGASR